MTLIDDERLEKLTSLPANTQLLDAERASPLFNEWLQLRQDFVESQGWHYGDDFDRYDEKPDTLQLVNRQNGRVQAGMRLTPVRSIEESLSWSMLSGGMQDASLRSGMPDLGDNIWDLTRLVSRADIPRSAMPLEFIQLFGAGLHLTTQSMSEKPYWIFATSRPFYRLLQHYGLDFTTLSQGKVKTEDKHETVFCYASPFDQATYIQQHQAWYGQTHQAAERGMRAIAEWETEGEASA